MTNNNEQMAALREAIADKLGYIKANNGKYLESFSNEYMEDYEDAEPKLDAIMQLITTTIAEAVREARIDELRQVMRETETGDVSIWVYKWAKNRIATLTTHKDGNDG